MISDHNLMENNEHYKWVSDFNKQNLKHKVPYKNNQTHQLDSVIGRRFNPSGPDAGRTDFSKTLYLYEKDRDITVNYLRNNNFEWEPSYVILILFIPLSHVIMTSCGCDDEEDTVIMDVLVYMPPECDSGSDGDGTEPRHLIGADVEVWSMNENSELEFITDSRIPIGNVKEYNERHFYVNIAVPKCKPLVIRSKMWSDECFDCCAEKCGDNETGKPTFIGTKDVSVETLEGLRPGASGVRVDLVLERCDCC